MSATILYPIIPVKLQVLISKLGFIHIAVNKMMMKNENKLRQ